MLCVWNTDCECIIECAGCLVGHKVDDVRVGVRREPHRTLPKRCAGTCWVHALFEHRARPTYATVASWQIPMVSPLLVRSQPSYTTLRSGKTLGCGPLPTAWLSVWNAVAGPIKGWHSADYQNDYENMG